MDKFVVCNRCERAVDAEGDGCVKYEKEVLGITVTLHMCLDCLEELMFEDEK
ncbi:TPA: hypothetical protein ACG3PI_003457 [Clostridioides difficile]